MMILLTICSALIFAQKSTIAAQIDAYAGRQDPFFVVLPVKVSLDTPSTDVDQARKLLGSEADFRVEKVYGWQWDPGELFSFRYIDQDGMTSTAQHTSQFAKALGDRLPDLILQNTILGGVDIPNLPAKAQTLVPQLESGVTPRLSLESDCRINMQCVSGLKITTSDGRAHSFVLKHGMDAAGSKEFAKALHPARANMPGLLRTKLGGVYVRVHPGYTSLSVKDAVAQLTKITHLDLSADPRVLEKTLVVRTSKDHLLALDLAEGMAGALCMSWNVLDKKIPTTIKLISTQEDFKGHRALVIQAKARDMLRALAAVGVLGYGLDDSSFGEQGSLSDLDPLLLQALAKEVVEGQSEEWQQATSDPNAEFSFTLFVSTNFFSPSKSLAIGGAPVLLGF